jgi:formate dehydrogenase major subunit/formate dehydrogenase alpha subunit
MTNPMSDIAENARSILIIGSNTTEQHPVFGYTLRQAVLQRGTKLVVADPRNIPISDFATLHLRHQPGTDVALVNGLAHIILKNGWHDEVYISSRTEGFEEFADSLVDYTPEAVSEITGLSVEEIQQAAEILSKNSPMAVVWAMGITQHTTGVMNVFSLANLQMLLGNMGVPGGGTNPLRGQNNVQGACDMGALVNVFPGYQQVANPEVREKFNQAWALSSTGAPGSEATSLFGEFPGRTVTEMTNGLLDGSLRGLYIIGENPIMSDPNSNHVRECFEAGEFIVLQEIFPSETSQYADILLPGVTFAEKTGSFTNTERRIQLVSQAIDIEGEARNDWEITSDLAKKILELEGRIPEGTHAGWEYVSPDEIMGEISALTPIYTGVSTERLMNGDQLQWPVRDQAHPGTPILHVGNFSRGLGKFNVCHHVPAQELPDDEYPLLLTTGRVLYHWHGAEMTRRVDSLVALYPESVVELHPDDAARFGIVQDAKVRLASRRGEMIAKVMVTERIAPGVVFGGFHFPGEQNVNNLTNTALDPTAKIPEYKVCAVKIEAVGS